MSFESVAFSNQSLNHLFGVHRFSLLRNDRLKRIPADFLLKMTRGFVIKARLIAVTSAVEAFIYARHLNAREQRFSAALLPVADGLALQLTLR